MNKESTLTSSSLLQRYQRLFALGLLGVLLLLLIMVSGVVTRQQSRMLEDATIRRGIATQQHIAELARDPIVTGKTQDLSTVIQIAQSTDDDIEGIMILNPQGDIVAATDPHATLPINKADEDSVVSDRDYLQGPERIFLSPIRNKAGDILGVSYLRMSQKKISRLAFEAAAKLDAAIFVVFLILGFLLNALLKKVKRLADQEMIHSQKLTEAYETEKRLQSQLVRSEKMATLGQLASSMAHELRNPLAAIKNALYYIRDCVKDSPMVGQDPTVLEFFGLAESEIKTATRIITDLLDYSRTIRLDPKPTDLHATLHYVNSTLQAPSNIKIVEHFAREMPPVMIDADRMKQVFVNIGTNAIQAMNTGGELRVNTQLVREDSEGQPWVNVEFSDSGEGITAENMAKIFEPMFSTKNNGTGLGLSICQSIVQAHGGKIIAQSEVGKGTTFTVRFPLEGNHHDR